MHEMGEEAHRVRTLDELGTYTADQLIAVPASVYAQAVADIGVLESTEGGSLGGVDLSQTKVVDKDGQAMTDAERAERPPSSTHGVESDRVIVMFGGMDMVAGS